MMVIAEQAGKKVVPVRAGLFHMPEGPDDEPYLIGSKCKECGLVFWPSRVVCPLCVRDDTMSELRLSRRGHVESFAVVYQAQKGFTAPYVQGVVKMPEGPAVTTIFTGVENVDSCLQKGQEVEMVVDRLREDEYGNTIVAWKFRPIQAK
jgi:uncharacterized OB-fold protein